MIRGIQIWIIALESGYADYQEVSAWAERCWMEASTVPAGMLEAFLAASKAETLNALYDWCQEANKDMTIQSDDLEISPLDHTALYLGFLYLGYKKGGIERNLLLKKAGEKTDSSNYSDPSCEEFYLLLNEIDGGGPTISSPLPLEDRIEMLFLPFAEIAETELLRIRDKTTTYIAGKQYSFKSHCTIEADD